MGGQPREKSAAGPVPPRAPMAANFFRLCCRNSHRYVRVRGNGELALCADKHRADQFVEELIEFTLPVAEVQFGTEFRLVRVPGDELNLQRMQGVINH